MGCLFQDCFAIAKNAGRDVTQVPLGAEGVRGNCEVFRRRSRSNTRKLRRTKFVGVSGERRNANAFGSSEEFVATLENRFQRSVRDKIDLLFKLLTKIKR